MKRLESISRSPIYSFFGECLNGMSTIRAFRDEKRFILQMQTHLDNNTRIYYGDMYGNRWIGYRLEFIGALIVLCASLLVVIRRDSLSEGNAGLSITYALNVTYKHFNFEFRQNFYFFLNSLDGFNSNMDGTHIFRL